MYMIYVENMAGEIIRAMTWNGNKEVGIQRLKQEVKDKKIPYKKIWAELIKTTA